MRTAAAVLLLVMLLVPAPRGAGAQEDVRGKLDELEKLLRQLDEARDTEDWNFEEGSREVRVYNVADLTSRLDWFIHPNLRLDPAGAEISENHPLFGSTVEGLPLFLAMDELVDLVRSSVCPEAFEGDQAWIEYAGNRSFLLVAGPDVQEEVRGFLHAIRERVRRTITVEIRALAFPPGSPLPPARLTAEEGRALLARAEAGDGATVALSGRITGMNGQRISFFRGRQQSFVQDYDVEVAEGSNVADPIVGVLQTGLSLDVRAMERGPDLLVLDIRGELAVAPDSLRTLETAAGPVSAPLQDYVEFGTTLTIEDGGHALVRAGPSPDGGTVAILVRARATGGDR